MGDVTLYNPHDGLTGRDGGPYLDQEERRLAEIVRARVENREPDFDNAPATAGTPLVSAAVLVATANPQSNPSQLGADPLTAAVAAKAVDDDFPVTAFSTRKQTKDEVKAEKDAATTYNPASSAVIGKDAK